MKNKNEIYRLKDWRWEGEAEERLGQSSAVIVSPVNKDKSNTAFTDHKLKVNTDFKMLKKDVEICCDDNR